MRVEGWSITDVGRKREHNEDSLLCLPDIGLFVVADGMGGHRAGERASRIAIETVEREVRAHLAELVPAPSRATRLFHVPLVDPVITVLTEAVRAASGAILDEVDRDPELQGMGTTVSGLLVGEARITYMHIGDSRIYHLSDGQLRRITTDHSLVQEQMDAGLISEEQAQVSRFRNIITRSVGFERDIRVDCASVATYPGDLLLLCSDGLSNMVREEELLEILMHKDPPTALQFFVMLANSRGGDDNISAVLVRLG